MAFRTADGTAIFTVHEGPVRVALSITDLLSARGLI